MTSIEIVSPAFFVFAVIVLAGYHIFPLRYRLVWLLLASYFFYATWGWAHLIVLLVFTMLNYWLAILLEKSRSKHLFKFAIASNALSFLLLKALVGPYGLNILRPFVDVSKAGELTIFLLPIGFSFYILQNISYLVDVYREQIPAEQNLIAFALYLAYFPKMIAGPIERAKSFIPQLKQNKTITSVEIEKGIYLILLGLFRKIVIADRLALFLPEKIFSSPELYTFPERILWILIFAFILYNDFAGYTSIIRGVSVFFGIDLSVNFKQPMLARSFSDFWARWHISLSEWLRDYIFFPVRRWLSSKKPPSWLTLTIPPMITMAASGYWHGAYFSVISWGFLHGLFLTGEQILQRKGLLQKNGWLTRYFGVLVFIATTFAWILFSTPGLGAASRYLLGPSPHSPSTLRIFDFPDLVILATISLWMDKQEQKEDDLVFPRKWTRKKQAIGVGVLLAILLIVSTTGTDLSGFIYQGF